MGLSNPVLTRSFVLFQMPPRAVTTPRSTRSPIVTITGKPDTRTDNFENLRAVGAARTKYQFVKAYQEAACRWDEEVREYINDREQRGAPIQWYEEPGLAKGAYATLLVVEFSDGRQGYPPRWKAASIGDSCLFQVRGESLYSCFPMSDVAEFSYQPPLLPSRIAGDDVIRRNVCLGTQNWEPEDKFYIVTDALAAWFLRSWDAGKQPWVPLRDFDVDADFTAWVDQQRDLNKIHNDDTTLVRIDTW